MFLNNNNHVAQAQPSQQWHARAYGGRIDCLVFRLQNLIPLGAHPDEAYFCRINISIVCNLPYGTSRIFFNSHTYIVFQQSILDVLVL